MIEPIKNPLREFAHDSLTEALAKVEYLLRLPLGQQLRREGEVIAARLRAQLAVIP